MYTSTCLVRQENQLEKFLASSHSFSLLFLCSLLPSLRVCQYYWLWSSLANECLIYMERKKNRKKERKKGEKSSNTQKFSSGAAQGPPGQEGGRNGQGWRGKAGIQPPFKMQKLCQCKLFYRKNKCGLFQPTVNILHWNMLVVFSLTVTHGGQDLEAVLMHSILLVHSVFCLAAKRGTSFWRRVAFHLHRIVRACLTGNKRVKWNKE